MIGTSLSHYLIEAELGRGGMGIVYKAQDTKLERTVAIKILPASALSNEDDRTRFYREAKSAAQLHHPNIASVFEIDEAVPEGGDAAEPRPFIAMEYVSGGTVQDLVKKGLLPLADAVNITSQVAEALKAAHAKDIVHRDIKSANVMITADGVAKVLDFGLAKTNQSTMLTRMGSTLGTVAYMSPEQARGQEVDGRTDLYSLGTMLFEMIAGRLPFAGEYEQAVVYGILNEPPEPLTSLRTGIPMQLEWIVNKLLAKDADYRYQTAGDLLADLKSLDLTASGMSRRSMPAMSGAALHAQPMKEKKPWWMYGAILAAIIVGASGTWFLKPEPETPEKVVSRFEVELETRLDRTGRHTVAISPDGRHLAYIVDGGIGIRSRNDLMTSRLLELETAREPFFSPNSQWIAYEDDLNNRLMRISTGGGASTLIAPLSNSIFGASWAENGDIFLGFGRRGMGRIVNGSSTIDMFFEGDSTEARYHGPRLLPDGHTVVYTKSLDGGEWDEGELRLYDLDAKTDKPLYAPGKDARYVDTGHLVFHWNNTLYAMPFDPKRNEASGKVVPIAEEVADAGSTTGAGQFDISNEGLLVTVKGDAGENAISGQLYWIAKDGTATIFASETREWAYPKISRDGSMVAVTIGVQETQDIWVGPTAAENFRRLTSSGHANFPVWDPNGNRVAYEEEGVGILARYPGDVTRVDTLYLGQGSPTSWSSDGRWLLFDANQEPRNVIQVLDVATRIPRPFMTTDDGGQGGEFSPDGRWVVYYGFSNGGPRVHVRSFPDGGEALQVSEGLGFRPHWSREGTHIYFNWLASNIAVSEFDTKSGNALPPVEFPVFLNLSFRTDYAVHTDGRLLFSGSQAGTSEGNAVALPELEFVIGFDADLRARAPKDQ
ncbi:protein kinase [bacterium]|nr:protein kinase [bacterium]